jgi:acetylornithine deacetylase/succinyl-diaminopimelate desuccinylase-like protein
MFGGVAANPIHILSRILSKLHDDNGKITLKGFYNKVHEIPQSLKDQWNSLNFDADKFLSDVGLSNVIGECRYSPLEKLWSQPTCEINGIWGGYIQPGFKTVLPSKASAKISFRLVGSQDPKEILESFRDHVKNNLPSDCSAEFKAKAGSGASSLEIDASEIRAAQEALEDEWGVSAKMVGCGGSIPIGDHFKNILGMNSLLVGFGLEDDKIHSPNEKYSLSSFQKGTRSWARILYNLSRN